MCSEIGKGGGFLTLGIIGGCGPLVGAHFFSSLLAMTDASGDGDYPDVLLAALASTPDRSAHLLDPRAPDPTPMLLHAAKMLTSGGADVLLLLCHTAHAFLPTLRARVSVPILDLVSIGVSYAAAHGVRRLGVLCSEGTFHAHLFELAAAPLGVEILYPPKKERAALHAWIYGRIKSGGQGDDGALLAAGTALSSQGAQAALLACTELSLPAAAPHTPLPLPCIDPLVLLACRALFLCGKKVKEEYTHDAAWRPALLSVTRPLAVHRSWGRDPFAHVRFP